MGDPMESSIQVKQLSKKYKTFDAVKQIDFEVKQGSIYALLGENGAGKSTTMNILCTLLKKNSGKVMINSWNLDSHQKQIRKSIGIVFQENTLDGELTLKENLMIRGKLYLSKTSELKQRIQVVSEQLQLTTIMDKKIKHCSGGQKRLAMIARALIGNPSLLVLDEPTCGLDPSIRSELWKTIHQLRETGTTIFFSSHYLDEAAQADEICILHEGKVLIHSNLSQLMRDYGGLKLMIETKQEKQCYEGMNAKQALKQLNQSSKMNYFECKSATLEEIYLKLIHGEQYANAHL